MKTTNKTDGATARPWIIADYPEKAQKKIATPDGLGIALVFGDTEEEVNANAELIVKAVNAYDDLLEACKELLLAIDSNIEGVSGEDYVKLQYIACEYDSMKQAIKKAEGV